MLNSRFLQRKMDPFLSTNDSGALTESPGKMILIVTIFHDINVVLRAENLSTERFDGKTNKSLKEYHPYVFLPRSITNLFRILQYSD